MSVLLSLTHCLLLLQRVSVRASPFTKLVSSFKAVFDIQVVGSILQLLYEKHSFSTDALQAQMLS